MREMMRWRGGSAAVATAACCASACSIVALQATLNRFEYEAVGAIHEDDDQQDHDEQDRRAVVLAREIEQITEARAAADQLGRERLLPRDAEADAQGREHERVERGDRDAHETLQA